MFSFLSKYITTAVLSIILGVLGTGYVAWRHEIEQAALAEYNAKQLEQTIEDQKKYINDLEKINKDQTVIDNDLKKKNDELNKKLADLDVYLNSTDAKKGDRASSEILKRTIRELSGQSK